MKFKEFYNEAIRRSNDNKIDTFIKDRWNGEVRTFEYNEEGLYELAKKYEDVLVTSDKKFMHITINKLLKKETEQIISKYNLKEIK